MTRPRARWTIALLLAGALLGGCIVPVVPGPGPGRHWHYHHHDWR
jgi:hypothetical protein